MKLLLRALFCAMLIASSIAYADPLKVRIWVGFNPGGPDDLVAREIQQQIVAEDPSIKVNIEYAPGAGGIIALRKVVTMQHSDTVEIIASGGSNLLVSTYLTKTNKEVDLDKDVMILSPIARSQLVVISSNKSDITNIKTLREAAKTRNIKYASIGVGSMTYLTSAYLIHSLDIKSNTTNVPYQGSAQFYPDLIENRLDYSIDFIHSAVPKIKSGMVHPVAVTGSERNVLLPSVPTLKEQGVDTFPVSPWIAWFVASHTPNDEVYRLRKVFAKIFSNADNIKRFAHLGIKPVSAEDVAQADAWYESQKKIFKKELLKFENSNL